jgi:GNAT superfamily N-acetyltransferase
MTTEFPKQNQQEKYTEIQYLTPEDIEQSILQGSAIVQHGFPVYENNLEEAENDLRKHLRNSRLLGYKENNQIKGMCILQEKGARFLDIAIVLSPEIQNKGIGTQLINSAARTNSHMPFIIGCTQNSNLIRTARKALGVKNELLPGVDGRIRSIKSQLEQYYFQQITRTKQIDKTKIQADANLLQAYYGSNSGLYGSTNINKNNNIVPIDTSVSGDAILFAYFNQYYKGSLDETILKSLEIISE